MSNGSAYSYWKRQLLFISPWKNIKETFWGVGIVEISSIKPEIFPRQIRVPSKIFQSSFCEWACFQFWSLMSTQWLPLRNQISTRQSEYRCWYPVAHATQFRGIHERLLRSNQSGCFGWCTSSIHETNFGQTAWLSSLAAVPDLLKEESVAMATPPPPSFMNLWPFNKMIQQLLVFYISCKSEDVPPT